MGDSPFGSDYASVYDWMYVDKDYEHESDVLEEAFHRFGGGPAHSILDLGSGTGNHALELVRRGHEVVGVDLSADMIDIARRKADEAELAIEFHHGDLRTVHLDRRFDAVLLMFAVLGYQRTDADVRAALQNARSHAEPGAVLVLDVWHGPAVLADPPGEGRRMIATPTGDVTRSVSSDFDQKSGLCTVRYELTGTGVQSREEHVMRPFFPAELEGFLGDAGFELAALTAFNDLDRPASTDTWTATVVARAL